MVRIRVVCEWLLSATRATNLGSARHFWHLRLAARNRESEVGGKCLDPADADQLFVMVEEMAASLKQAEGSGGIALFYDQAPSRWERPPDGARKMSEASRASLLTLWQAVDVDLHTRKAAFRLWGANELEGDLAILQASLPSSGLDDLILRERLTRGDTSAIPLLREKILDSRHPWAWWWCAKYAWSDDLIEFMDEELTRRLKTLVG